MKLLPVSALSSWIHCPKQFYISYVLDIEEPPKDVMILGLIKHKLHEKISQEEKQIISTLKKEDNIQEKLHSAYTRLLQIIITNQANALRMVSVPLTTAFQKAVPIVKFESTDNAARITPLLQQGLTGNDLWNALTPKVKVEYSIQSQKLGLKGRIDRLELYENTLLPVELKSGNPPNEGIWEEHKIQATSYAMMLEETFNTTVPEAIVHYVDHNSRRTIVLNPFLKEKVTETTTKVRNCLETKEIPDGCGRDGCQACNNKLFIQNRI